MSRAADPITHCIFDYTLTEILNILFKNCERPISLFSWPLHTLFMIILFIISLEIKYSLNKTKNMLF